MKQKTIAIIHFNTPELTECCIMSIRKQGCYWPVVVFDNSRDVVWPADEGLPERTLKARPFSTQIKGVKVIDNTNGQQVDFDKALQAFPDKHNPHGAVNGWGSDVHMMSVEKLFELLPDGFVLVESDILLRENPQTLWQEEYSFVAYVQKHQAGNRFGRGRILPMLCYLNVPKFRAEGVHYFDPDRSWMLHKGEMNPNNWYDTGASLLEDVLAHRPRLKGLHVDIRPLMVHLGGASYKATDIKRQAEWLKQNRELWEPIDNSDAKIFVCAHTDFEQVVWNDVYEVVDSRKLPKPKNAPSLYFSELWQMKKVSERKRLPKYIGFCQYRRYFDFMDAVPHLGQIIEKHGAITTKAEDILHPMGEQYGTFSNPEDLKITTDIIHERYPDFAPAWDKALANQHMHLGTLSIMKTEDWKEMLAVMWDVANELLKRLGGDMEKRVRENADAYKVGEFGLTLEMRAGGQMAERINSAWMDWKFPNAAVFPMKLIGDKIEVTFVGGGQESTTKKASKPKTTRRTNKKDK